MISDQLLRISTLALEFQCEGIKQKREGKFHSAKKYFALILALNEMQEFNEGIKIGKNLLISLVENEEEYQAFKDYGASRAKLFINPQEEMEYLKRKY